MKDNQVAWIGTISKSIADGRQAERDMLNRERGMGLVTEKLIQSKAIGDIRNAFGAVEVQLKNGKSMPLLDLDNHDPMAEVDSFADLPGSEPVDSELLVELQKQMETIVAVQNEMKELEFYKIDLEKPPFVDEDGVAIYDPDLPTYEQQAMIDLKNDRMAKDLWQPLMREGVIPENMIPDKYSEVVQTFAGASEAYEARLQEHSKDMSKADVFLEKFAPFKDIGSKALKAAGSFASFTGDVAALAENSSVIKDAAEAAEIIELIDVAFTATCDIIPLVVKEQDGVKAVDVFNDALKKVLEGAGVDGSITDVIHGAVGSAARSASAGVNLAKGDLEAAFQDFGDAITKAFGTTGDDSMKEIGAQIGKAVGSMGAAAKAHKAMTANPPRPGEALNAILKNVSTYVNSPEIKLVLRILGDGAEVLPVAVAERDAFAVMDFVGGTVAKAMAEAKPTPVNPEIANAVNTSISSAISGAKAGKQLADGNITEAFETIGGAIGTALGKTGNSDVAAIGTIIQTSVEAVARADGFKRAMAETPPNISAALSEMTGAINSAIGEGGFKSAVESLSGSGEGEDDPTQAIVDKVNEIAESEALAAATELGEMRLSGDKPITTEQLEALLEARDAEQEKAARSQEEKLRAYMEEEDKAFKEMLVTGMTPPDGEAQDIARAEERRIQSIEAMIAIVQRDKKTFELAQKICTKGPSLLADLVPGMSLVSACAEMAFMIADAVKHAEQLIIWTASMEDAGKAATVQLDAIMNRYGLEKKHVLRGRISIGIQAVKIAGEATKLSPAAPIGLAISSGASATSATFELAWAAQDYGEFREAWSTYKRALENPQDRKAARTALRKNATLSKYAMAYGALKDNNAIAKEAMRRCNITEATLAQQETSVDKLVEYLEALYSDDPVIVQAVPKKNDWYPGEVELNYQSFSRFYLKATTVADPLLGPDDVSRIKGVMADADRAYAEFHRLRSSAEPETAIPLEAEQLAISTTQNLVKSLKGYGPTQESGDPHAEMTAYIKTLAAMATLRWREVQKIAGQEQKALREKAKKKEEGVGV